MGCLRDMILCLSHSLQAIEALTEEVYIQQRLIQPAIYRNAITLTGRGAEIHTDRETPVHCPA